MAFNDKKHPQKKRSTARSESSVTILTPDCHFNGKLFCRGSSRIGGRIEGEVVSEGMLVIEEEALVTAEIKADEAVIQGAVKGKLYATGRVELTSTARFDGDIFSPSLVINEGAEFNGRSTVVSSAAADEAGPGKTVAKVEQLHKGNVGNNKPHARSGNGPEVGVG